MASGCSTQAVEEGTGVRCPACGYKRVHRLERKGFMQLNVYPLFGYYPWECGMCRQLFMIKKRYRRKRRSNHESSAD